MINKKKSFIWASLLAGGALLTQCTTESPRVPEVKPFVFKTSDTTWKTLSLREKIGQTMVIVSQYNDQIAPFGGNIDSFMQRYPVGGVFVAKWYFEGRVPKDSSLEKSIRFAMSEYERAARFPMLFTEDFEQGLGNTYPNYTALPALMSVGAANDTLLAYGYGKSIALEARDLGINWLLHPVADLNMNPQQSLVIERSISDDPNRALPLLSQQIKGMHDMGVVSTTKHFPGDGFTMHNQHLTTSVNSMNKAQWDSTYRRVFQGMINNGAPSFMVGHIRLPAYQHDSVKGMLLPASMSKDLMMDLLKGEMGFKGVLMSDALNMGGAAGFYDTELETSVQCFAAGIDIVLWPSLAYMDTVEARILRGEIPMSRLDDAVQRIWSIREQFGMLKKKPSIFTPLTEPDKAFVKQAGTKLAEKAVTLIEDRYKDLPMKAEKTKKILMVTIAQFDKTQRFQPTKAALEQRGFEVTMMHNPHFYNWGWRIDSLNKFDKVITCFENKYFDPLGSSFLKNEEAFAMWTVNMIKPEKCISISYSNPYYVNFYQIKVPLRINAYCSDMFTQEAVVKALCGEIPFQGTSPVIIDHEMLK